MWDLPGPGLKPMSPALAGGFLTTVPPGKSLPICFCMLSIFFIKVLHILFITILNHLSDNSNICVIFETCSDACFVSSDCVFSCLLAYLVIFCRKLNMMDWVNWPLLWGCVLIWLEVGLHLIFAVGARSFKFLCCPCFCLSFWLWASWSPLL